MPTEPKTEAEEMSAAPVPTCIAIDDRSIQARLYDEASGVHCTESLLREAADTINNLEGKLKQLRANLKDANRRADARRTPTPAAGDGEELVALREYFTATEFWQLQPMDAKERTAWFRRLSAIRATGGPGK